VRIGPANDAEFLAIEAFDFEPRAPIGLTPAIYSSRDDAFVAVPAGQTVKRQAVRRAVADLVISVSPS
jgi:hypothetical protein